MNNTPLSLSMLLIIFLLPLSISDKAQAYNLPPICLKIPTNQPRTPTHFMETSCDNRIVWFDCALGHYGLTRALIKKYAKQNKIPARLLATVLANELMDYSARDLTQETVYMTMHASAGIAQLQPIRLAEHRLVDPDPHTGKYDYFAIWQQLTYSSGSVKLAAQEISWIIKALNTANREGRDFPRYYIYPGEKIFRRSLYDNVIPLKTTQINHNLYPQNIQQEAALAHAVVMAYNNGGHTPDKHIIWFWNHRKHGSPLSENIKDQGLKKPAAHAQNARYYWASCFAQANWPDTKQYWFPDKLNTAPSAPQTGCRWLPKTYKRRVNGKRTVASYQCYCKFRDSQGLVNKKFYLGDEGVGKCGTYPLK